MLNRSQTVKRLIKLRKSFYEKELYITEPPGEVDKRIKKGIEDLIKDLIGELEEEQETLIDKILLKAFCGEITCDTALVAIHEVVLSGDYSKAGNP